MTKDQIVNICKRIEENKATEEEICALRAMALRACDAPEVARRIENRLMRCRDSFPFESDRWYGVQTALMEMRLEMNAAMREGKP